jgi:hypothetical protein
MAESQERTATTRRERRSEDVSYIDHRGTHHPGEPPTLPNGKPWPRDARGYLAEFAHGGATPEGSTPLGADGRALGTNGSNWAAPAAARPPRVDPGRPLAIANSSRSPASRVAVPIASAARRSTPKPSEAQLARTHAMAHGGPLARKLAAGGTPPFVLRHLAKLETETVDGQEIKSKPDGKSWLQWLREAAADGDTDAQTLVDLLDGKKKDMPSEEAKALIASRPDFPASLRADLARQPLATIRMAVRQFPRYAPEPGSPEAEEDRFIDRKMHTAKPDVVGVVHEGTIQRFGMVSAAQAAARLAEIEREESEGRR